MLTKKEAAALRNSTLNVKQEEEKRDNMDPQMLTIYSAKSESRLQFDTTC